MLIPDPDDAGASELYWNLVPGGWLQPIDRATLTVHLPAAAEDVQCGVGWDATTGCAVTGEGTQTLVVKAKGLDPRTPVTLPDHAGPPHAARAGRGAAVERALGPRARPGAGGARRRAAARGAAGRVGLGAGGAVA